MKNYSATSIFFRTILSIVLVSCSKDVPAISNTSETHSSAVANTAMVPAKKGDSWFPPDMDTSGTNKKAANPIFIADTSKVNTH